MLISIVFPAPVGARFRVRMYLPGVVIMTGVVGGDVKGIGILPSAATAGSEATAASAAAMSTVR
jgi:hypothetical protein